MKTRTLDQVVEDAVKAVGAYHILDYLYRTTTHPDLKVELDHALDALESEQGEFAVPIIEWTKKLGQQHWHLSGESTTFCGRPMLGNNYTHMDMSDKTPCEECEKAARVKHGIVIPIRKKGHKEARHEEM